MKKTLLLIVFISFFANISFAQEDKTVTVTVSGQGKTQDEAKQSALRNAIEQAFGAFISSNTEILNDELIKDEIISVSSGNIQSFELLSEVQMPDGTWSNTLKAVVSVNKLTTFSESKGISVEFKGGLFAINAKQQMFNEENEVKVIKNMCKVLKEISDKSFDFEIIADEPRAELDSWGKGSNTNKWLVPLIVIAKINSNFVNFSKYLSNTLNAVSLSRQEAEDYIKLDKRVYTVAIIPFSLSANKKTKKQKDSNLEIYYFRTPESVKYITDLMLIGLKNSLLNFIVNNGVNPIIGSAIINTKGFRVYDYVEGFYSDGTSIYENLQNIKTLNITGFTPIFYYSRSGGLPSQQLDLSLFSEEKYKILEFEKTFIEPNRYYGTGKTSTTNFVLSYFSEIINYNFLIQKNPSGLPPDVFINAIITFKNIEVGKRVVAFKFDQIFTTDEISKITEFKVETNSK